MFLWRISNYGDLAGRGGLIASARWHSLGHPIVYMSESAAGALAEVLVHLELDLDSLPTTYKLLKAEAPDDLPIRTVARSELPSDWRMDEILTRTIGDEWLASRSTALLRVPSAVVPETLNILLNPVHEDAVRIRVLWHREYPWDSHLFE